MLLTEVDLDDSGVASPLLRNAVIINRVHEAITAGLIQADNYDYDTRIAFRAAYMAMPLMEPNPEAPSGFDTVGHVDIMEGREYCYATNRHGAFGIFSLDDRSRNWLTGATLHLWHDELGPDGTWREDFDADTAFGVYQQEALEAALQSGVAA